jgi:hypothetical protein
MAAAKNKALGEGQETSVHSVRIEPEKFLEKLWRFAYDALFLMAFGLTVTTVGFLLASSDPVAIRASKVLLVIAWMFYSAAIRKANFFQSQTANRRALGDAVTSLGVGLLLAAGFYYIPWYQAPRIYTTGFSHIISPGTPAKAVIDVFNDSDYPSSTMNADGEIRLIPFTGNFESKAPSDIAANFAFDDSVAADIFKKSESSSILHDLPFKGGLSPHVKDAYTLWGDHNLTVDEINQHDQGKLIVFIGGRIKYKDSDGCVYKSDFCGFWGKSAWVMVNCHSGHFEQAVRLKDKCQTE